MYDPDGELPGDGIYAIGIIVTCIVIPICMGIAAGDETDKAQIETEEAEVQETSQNTPYCVTVEDNNVYIIQAYNVYKGYEEAEYYYCYVDENSYELLPIKDTKIVSSLEEAEDEADYYESEGFDVKWNLLKNKKQASI